MDIFERVRLGRLAQRLGAEFVNLHRQPGVRRALAARVRELRRLWDSRKSGLPLIRKRIKAIYANAATSDEAVSRAYDEEYGNGSYGYASALLTLPGFGTITGLSRENARTFTMLDIGAGSDELLRFCNTELSVPAAQLHGADVSEESRALIERDGFHAYVGRAEAIPLPENAVECLFLTYFIDYDTDQQATYDAVARLVRPGGKIVLEGLFPVQPFGLLKSDAGTHLFLTKGRSAVEDIELTCAAFRKAAEKAGKQVSLERIARGSRYVMSHYGFWKLPSYFLAFSCEKNVA